MIRIWLTIALLISCSLAHADYPPIKKNGQERWRIAYLEGGQYQDYQIIFGQILRQLMKMGWIENTEIPDEYMEDHHRFWMWICSNLKSDYLEFIPDGFYSAGFDNDKRKEVRQTLKKRIKDKDDIDFIFAMGTWAGQDMADAQMNVPTEVASSSDPVGAGIVISADDSGFPHMHTKIEPDRYKKQLQIFYELTGFSRLGFVMEDSKEGRTYSAYQEIKELADEAGFEMEICGAPFSNQTQPEAEQNVLECYRKLTASSDAVYVTVHVGVSTKSIPLIVKMLTDAKIPSFSQRGENEVEAGILMSISQADYSYAADFHAKAAAMVFHGKAPGSIPMTWNAPAKITLNLETADRIGWYPPYDVLKAADRLYDTIPE